MRFKNAREKKILTSVPEIQRENWDVTTHLSEIIKLQVGNTMLCTIQC